MVVIDLTSLLPLNCTRVFPYFVKVEVSQIS